MGKRLIYGTKKKEIPRIKNCKTLLVRTRISQNIEDDIIRRHPYDIQRLHVDLFWQKAEEIAGKYSVDTELRTRLFDDKSIPECVDVYERICFKIIPQNICISAIEAFNEVHMEAKRIAEHVQVKKIYTSACMFAICFLENLCGVYLKREGAKCYTIQHAVAEAMVEFWLATFRVIGFDGELTWGWLRESREAKFEYKPCCITRIPEYNQSKTISKDCKRILVIEPQAEDYNAGFINYSDLEEKYFQFLDSLAPNLYPNVVVRVRDSTDTEFCKKHQKYQGIHLETMGELSFEESVRRSDLVVNTYYSSCHVEAMCAGIPCVMFDSLTFFAVNSVLKGITDKLKEAGIYYENGSLAAEFVSKIEDYEAWWRGKEVQDVCVTCLESVAGDYKNLVSIWETEFMEDCD